MNYQVGLDGRPLLNGQYLADVGTGLAQDDRVGGFNAGTGTVLARNGDGQLVTNSIRIGGGSASRQQPTQPQPSDGPRMFTSPGGPVGGGLSQAPGGGRMLGSPGGPSGGSTQGGPSLNSYQPNPYLSQMADTMRGQMQQNLERNVMPSIRSNALAAGGFGGSRQGVVEANALNDANRSLNDSITGMNFQDFTNQMNRNLQQYGMDQGFALGMGNLGLGYTNANNNFYTAQRGQDLQQLGLGANLFNMGNQGWLSQGQGIYGLGQTQQQAPWQVINNANAGLGQWSGYGTTTSANQGGGAQGVLGGALAGGQLGSLWGGVGINSSSTPYIPSNGGLPFNALT